MYRPSLPAACVLSLAILLSGPQAAAVQLQDEATHTVPLSLHAGDGSATYTVTGQMMTVTLRVTDRDGDVMVVRVPLQPGQVHTVVFGAEGDGPADRISISNNRGQLSVRTSVDAPVRDLASGN